MCRVENLYYYYYYNVYVHLIQLEAINIINLNLYSSLYILLTKITATQDEVALRYYRVRGLYFLGLIFAQYTVYTAYCIAIAYIVYYML